MDERRDLDFRIRTESTTDLVPPNFADIVSGIVVLAAGEGDFLTIGTIHTTLYEMKPHEPILAGLRFSLTGDVCFSREIDRAIRSLVDWGSLKVIDHATVVVGDTRSYRSYLSNSFTKSQLAAIHSVSRRYHDRRHRDVQGFRKHGIASVDSLEKAQFEKV